MNKILPLFSSPVYCLEDSKYICDSDEINFINKLKYTYNQFANNNLSNDVYVLNNPILENLKNYCLSELNYYTNNILKIQQEFIITNSWVTVKNKNDSHHCHNHPNSIYSGVFYLSSPDSHLIIEGKPGMLGDYPFSYSYDEYNLFNSSMWKIPVKTGTLIIFPSNLNHRVEENTSDNPRIVLGFNSFVTGKLCNTGYSTDLTINCQ